MNSRGANNTDKLPIVETPEDVAVLYSWANLHGAKYRDFSASRREYRAQLRHRAAEQIREQELQAQAEAEAAASAADAAARQAQLAAMALHDRSTDDSREQALRDAGEASRLATAERIEAARRAEAAAAAEAAARHAEKEIAMAHESARRQEVNYANTSESRNGHDDSETIAVPGQISDPYTPDPNFQQKPFPRRRAEDLNPEAARPASHPNDLHPRRRAEDLRPQSEDDRYSAPVRRTASGTPMAYTPLVSDQEHTTLPPGSPSSSSRRRPQGYHPDEASGVRQIYRGSDFEDQEEYVAAEPARPEIPVRSRSQSAPRATYQALTNPQRSTPLASKSEPLHPIGYRPVDTPLNFQRPLPAENAATPAPVRVEGWAIPAVDRMDTPPDSRVGAVRGARGGRRDMDVASAAPIHPVDLPRTVSPLMQDKPSDPQRLRRAQEGSGNRTMRPGSDPARRAVRGQVSSTSQRQQYSPEPTGPAWLYAPHTNNQQAPQKPITPVTAQPSVGDTLQQSRERVAARWYALKGVFEQPGQEQPEPVVRQKEIRTPVLAVFSLAGGVGKTCLVATLGRALSAMGEKVLLTDTTSHGLLPFYFGASELRQGVVRTFSPPSGSTDAPIYLVSHDVDLQQNDEETQEQLVEEILENGKGTHRVLLDLTPGTGWVARRMARLSPTIVVPLAPDMNSVISLQSVEKFFQGATDADGKPVQPFYLLNQFDVSLPLHLDVREVLRRQLGDRLLPFVIRRAPAVSEALAEGMTVVDYAPDAPVTEDYVHVATWLRNIAAPATAGFRTVRWSER